MKWLPPLILICVVMLSCKSPTDLDVDRKLQYVDGAVHPTRLSFYYYFGDSAYEAIVIDTTMLNTIWIEGESGNRSVTIPRFIFQLPDTLATAANATPFVRKFCFAVTKKQCNGVYTNCQNVNSWIAGEYKDLAGGYVPFSWMTDNSGRLLRLAFYELDGVRTLKGSMQIVVADPSYSRYETYRGLITLEF